MHDGVYARTIELQGRAGTVAVSHDRERTRLRARIRFPSLDAIPLIMSRLRQLFDLDADVTVICEALSRDPCLAPLVAEQPGLRVPGAWDPFELSLRAVLGQQISVLAATRLAGRIAAQHGEPLPPSCACPGLDTLFPRPAELASARLGGMPAARAGAINALASSAARDAALFERGPDLESSIARLCALPGIGPWTASYIAMRAMREPDAFPSGDIGLLRAFDVGSGRPSATELTERSQAWRPWRAYAAVHLWSAPRAQPRARGASHASATLETIAA